MSCYSKEELESMLEDVINELDLSNEKISLHGQLGTSVSELVRMVLDEKDLKIRMLESVMIQIKPRRL